MANRFERRTLKKGGRDTMRGGIVHARWSVDASMVGAPCVRMRRIDLPA